MDSSAQKTTTASEPLITKFAEARSRQLADLIPSMVWTCRSDGSADYFNNKWYSLTGQSPEESLGMGWTKIIHPDDRDRVTSAWESSVTSGNDFEIEFRYLMANERYYWHLVRAVPVLDEAGNIDHWFGVSTDIDDKHESEEMSAAMALAMFEAVVDGIITFDNQGIIQTCNPATERLFGYQMSEVVGQNITMLMPEYIRGKYRKYLASFLQTGVPKIIDFGREVEGSRKDGSVFAMELSVSEVKLQGQRLFTAIVRDITERKEMHAVIQESQRKLSTLISNLPGAAYRYLIDGDWKMDFISDGCLDLCGYSPTEMVNSNPLWTELMHSDDAARVADKVQDSIEQRKPYHFEYRIQHRDGEERWVWEQGQAIFVDDRPIALEGILTDITASKKSREKLLQSERLAAMGQMISSIAHESRNALQRIQAGVDMLELDIPADSVAGHDLSQIGKARTDLQSLLNGLRDFAAPVVLDWQKCNLADVWQQTWRNLDCLKANRQVELVEQTQGVDLHCTVDSFRIEQIFRNLIENSFAACSDPVKIKISCSDSELDSVPAVSISVRDNGPGLTQEQQDRIFDAFYTTKPKGTGLGMAIALKTIQAHRGTLVAGNGNGGGAEFIITLPREQS